MKNRRMLLLIGLLAAVLAIRWWDPLARTPSAESAAVVRQTDSHADQHVVSFGPPGASSAVTPDMPGGMQSASPSNDRPAASKTWPVRAISSGPVGNAFALRTPVVMAPPPPPPVKVQAPVAFVGPLQPPPPPPEPAPQLQVIGTWKDGSNSAVFLSSPTGTLLARVGDTVLADYKVQDITAQQISLLRLSTKKVWSLPIPATPPAPDTWPGR